MTKSYSFPSLVIVAILLSAYCIQYSESVFGILTPPEGKRGFENDFLRRKISTLKAVRQKLQQRKYFDAVITKMVKYLMFLGLAQTDIKSIHNISQTIQTVVKRKSGENFENPCFTNILSGNSFQNLVYHLRTFLDLQLFFQCTSAIEMTY